MKRTFDGTCRSEIRTRPFLTGLLALLVLGFLPFAGADSPNGLSASMTVDRSEAAPGDWVTFLITIEPYSKDARDLVVMDILPEGLAFDSAEAPSSCKGGDGRWVCSQPENFEAFSIAIRTTVGPGTEGLELVNTARIEFEDDDDDREVVTVQAGVQVVEAPPSEPYLAVQFSVSQETVVPGGELNYRINVTNNGTAPASNVSVIASLPAAMVLVSASPWPVERDGELIWSLESLAVDSFEILFNATVPSTSGLTEIQVGVAVTYGNGQGGEVYVQTPPSTLNVAPSPAAPAASMPPLLVGAIVVAGLCVLVALRIVPLPFRPGEGAEEIFLLHRSGVVLNHFSAHPSGMTDSDIVGGMMAAVRMFVEDSVTPHAGPLREIRFGRANILFVTGDNVTLAAVNPKGNAERFVDRATKFLREFEEMNDAALANFDGNAGGLEGIEAAFGKFAGSPAGRDRSAKPETGFVPRQ